VNEELVRKGRQIIEELGSDRPDILSRWMAHYVAELMEKVESGDLDEAETQTSVTQCADLILRLWEIKVQEETNRIQNRFNSWFARASGAIYPLLIDDDEDKHHYENLAKVLAAPESIRAELSAEAGVIFWSLSDVEHWLIELLWISEALNTPEADSSDDAAQRLFKNERKAEAICSRIARVFPAFADLSLEDLAVTRDQVAEALKSIYQLRLVFLGE
jgi:hypothetical protein